MKSEVPDLGKGSTKVKNFFERWWVYVSLSYLRKHEVFEVLIGGALPWFWTLEAIDRGHVIFEHLRYVFIRETEK